MKHIYIVGNWKSNKNSFDVDGWLKELYQHNPFIQQSSEHITAIVAAPFVYLPLLRQLNSEFSLPIHFAAQNCSQYIEGAYTGEVTASMIAEFATYVIIGHSERRSLFHEDDAMLAEKVIRAKEAGLEVIFCVPDAQTPVPEGINIVAYEPVWAIGTGKTDSPENANGVAAEIKHRTNVPTVIYGGSVSPANIDGFISTEYLDGVLPGKVSLDPQSFSEMLQIAQKHL
jgi:triosephosphate isomerase